MIQEAFQDYEKIAKENALSIAKSKLVREKLKSFLAVITAEFLAKDFSVSKAETLARADQRYRDCLQEAQKTIQSAEIAKSLLKKIEMEFDWRRTEAATKRAEMNML